MNDVCSSCKQPLPVGATLALCTNCSKGVPPDSMSTEDATAEAVHDDTIDLKAASSTQFTTEVPRVNARDAVTDATISYKSSIDKDLGNESGTKSATVSCFGDYEILGEVARGGMGIIFKARQLSLNRVVALKMILAGQLANDEDAQRFQTEAKAAAKLDHPNIVPVFEVGQQDGQAYFTMGYVEGQSLADLMADGPLSPRIAAELVTKVARAVDYAHSQGVVHRDLKPSNILLSPPAEGHGGKKSSNSIGEPKVTDFGLAKQLDGDSDLTGTGQILGTPSYMPVEQATGRIEDIGPWSDTYSLGALLYALICGRPPFQSASPIDTLRQVLEQEPVAPRQLNPSIPRDLETIALKALSKEREKRYATAQALAEDLERFLNEKPILARPARVHERAWRWCRRNPALAGSFTLVLLTLSVGTGVSTYFALQASNKAQESVRNERQARFEKRRADQERDLAVVAKKIAERQRRAAAIERDISNRRLYVADMLLAHRARSEHNILRTQQLLDAHQDPGNGEDLRGWEWYYLRSRCFGSRIDFRGQHESYIESVVWHPDDQTIASASKEGTVKIWNANSGEVEQTLAAPRDHGFWLAWNRRGNYLLARPSPVALATARKTKVLVWERATGQKQLEVEARKAVWSPDGRRLVVITSDGQLEVWESESKGIERWSEAGAALTSISWSGDGKQIAVTKDTEVVILNASMGQIDRTIRCPFKPVATIWRPSGRQLAVSGQDKVVRVYDVEAGEVIQSVAGNNNRIETMSWSPDGRYLAVCDAPSLANSQQSVIKIWNSATEEVEVSLPGSLCAWQADGTQLAVAGNDKSLAVWSAGNWKLVAQFNGHTSEIYTLAWSREGSRIASGGADRTAKIWEVPPKDEMQQTFRGRGPIAWNEVKNLLAVGDQGKVNVYVVETKKLEKVLGSPANTVALNFSPSGEQLAHATYDYRMKKGELIIWNVESWKVSVKLPLSGIGDLTWSPDGSKLLVSGAPYRDSVVRVLDAKNGQELLKLPGHQGKVGVSWINSALIVTSAYVIQQQPRCHGIQVWDSTTGDRVRFIKPSAEAQIGVNSKIAINSKGTLIAAGDWDSEARVGRIALWDLNSGELLHTFRGHDKAVDSLAFHPTESRLATGGGSEVKLWELKIGRELLTLGRDSKVGQVIWSPDGKQLLATDSGGTVTVWDASKGYARAAPLPTDYFKTSRRSAGFF